MTKKPTNRVAQEVLRLRKRVKQLEDSTSLRWLDYPQRVRFTKIGQEWAEVRPPSSVLDRLFIDEDWLKELFVIPKRVKRIWLVMDHKPFSGAWGVSDIGIYNVLVGVHKTCYEQYCGFELCQWLVEYADKELELYLGVEY